MLLCYQKGMGLYQQHNLQSNCGHLQEISHREIYRTKAVLVLILVEFLT